LLSAKPRLGSQVSTTLVNLNSWISSIEAGTTEHQLNPVSVKVTLSRAGDSIRVIADSLSENASGIERDLLSKSLQETLLYCTGIDLELDYAEIKVRVLRFLSTKGRPALIEQFLSLCFFNLVWFHIGDSFRTDARTLDSFERDIDRVDKICQKIAASMWSSFESRDGELGPGAAEELVRSIEDRLRGDSHGLEPRT
jgi:hypothetical protein